MYLSYGYSKNALIDRRGLSWLDPGVILVLEINH